MSNIDNGPVREPGKWESVDTDSYDERWKKMAEDGQNPHGEADFIMRFEPASVLDGGCGTGRIATELSRRGIDVVGVDLDEPFIAAAKAKAPELDFRLDDLMTVDCERAFDLVLLAGNVMIFVEPGTEAAVVQNMADHLAPGGRLVSGFQLGRAIGASEYDEAAVAAGLQQVERWSTWDGDAASADDNYVVFVHQKPS